MFNELLVCRTTPIVLKGIVKGLSGRQFIPIGWSLLISYYFGTINVQFQANSEATEYMRSYNEWITDVSVIHRAHEHSAILNITVLAECVCLTVAEVNSLFGVIGKRTDLFAALYNELNRI